MLDVQTPEDVSDCMEPALSYQYMFERKTSPWEMELWDEEELHNFKVDVENISRVYYVKCSDDDFGSDFYLLMRMKYMGKHVFVELSAGCDYTGFDCQGGGDIYITFNPNNFFNVALESINDEEFLLESLKEDGYHIEQHQETKQARIEAWSNSSSDLKLMSREAIQNNHGSVDDFIEGDAISDYLQFYS